MANEAFQALTIGDVPDDIDPLSVELVYAVPLSQNAVQSRLASVLPEAGATVSAAFDPEGDRFHFIDFPNIDPRGQETEIFTFARDLRRAMEADEANPVLSDSLYGAQAVGAVVAESFFNVCETPRNSSLPFGWHHPRINTLGAWSHNRGAGSTVAVIDTGYTNHAELAGVITQNGEINLVEGGNTARDPLVGGFLKHPGHGTLVSSVVASRGSVDLTGDTSAPGAVTGTAPDAKVMPVRAIRSVIDFTQRRIGRAIRHAAANGADVIVMALGGPNRVASTEAALRAAVNAGCVIVCAAGNCWPRVVFPAAYAPLGICTAVAALQPDLQPWDKTGRGPQISFSAYGEHVWGAAKNRPQDPNAGIRASQGTTLATSMTAGVAALWVARHGGRQALLGEAQARATTVQALWIKSVTHGMVPPPVWGGSADLGAGVIDAARTLNTPLPGAGESTAAPPMETESTLNILQMHLAGTEETAAAELDPSLADLAPEIIWLSYRAGARQRVMDSDTEAPVVADRTSPELTEALRNRPALRAAVGM